MEHKEVDINVLKEHMSFFEEILEEQYEKGEITQKQYIKRMINCGYAILFLANSAEAKALKPLIEKLFSYVLDATNCNYKYIERVLNLYEHCLEVIERGRVYGRDNI